MKSISNTVKQLRLQNYKINNKTLKRWIHKGGPYRKKGNIIF